METKETIEARLAKKTFIESSSMVLYIFNGTQLTTKSNSISFHKYEIYQENSNLYLKLTPPIFTEDLLIHVNNDMITFSEKFSERHRMTLIQKSEI